MERVYKFLKNCGTYYLATVDGDQARVRPFGTIDMFDGGLYIQTGRKKDVAKQIFANPKIEICAFDGKSWLRISAKPLLMKESKQRSICLTNIRISERCITRMMTIR